MITILLISIVLAFAVFGLSITIGTVCQVYLSTNYQPYRDAVDKAGEVLGWVAAVSGVYFGITSVGTATVAIVVNLVGRI